MIDFKMIEENHCLFFLLKSDIHYDLFLFI